MIEIQKSYKITLTYEQVRQLFVLLQTQKETEHFAYMGQYNELRSLYDELKKIFDSGIR
jgi:Leu/Phe-tRNA-protein transferase